MRALLDSVNKFFCSSATRRAIYVITTTLFIACLVFFVSLLQTSDYGIKSKLKELDVKTKALETQQKEYDELVRQQRIHIYDLDYKISNIKEKTTVIREYYKTEKAKVDTYNYKQIDSFFRKKYQY